MKNKVKKLNTRFWDDPPFYQLSIHIQNLTQTYKIEDVLKFIENINKTPGKYEAIYKYNGKSMTAYKRVILGLWIYYGKDMINNYIKTIYGKNLEVNVS